MRVWPLQIPFFPTSSTYQKHLKLSQCLEIDDRRSLSKFGDGALGSSHFTDHSVFYRPSFFRLVCKKINLGDIDLKFLGSLSEGNIDNCGKITIPRNYISKNELYEHFLDFADP